MQESATALLVDVNDYRNVTDLLTRRADTDPAHTAFEVPPVSQAEGAPWRQVSTRQFLDEVCALAKGFIAAGVVSGDSVAIMAATRYEWAVADLASWFAGAVVVPIYDSSSPAQVAAIVADAEVTLAIGGNLAQTEMLRNAFEKTGVGALGAWSMDAAPGSAASTIADLASRSGEIDDAELETRRTFADLDSPATIVYTSGTTGEPKGAVLTHRNFLGQVLNIAAAYGEVVHSGGNTIIFLPLAHVLARGLQLVCLASGMRIAHLSDTTAVVSTLAVIKPTFFVVVPRVLQKIQAAAANKAADKGLTKVWTSAAETAVQWGRYCEQREADSTSSARFALKLRHRLFDRVFYRRLREVMGGRVDYILSGGATLDASLSLFFRGIGVPVIEGYGLTETTAPLTGNLPGNIRSGSVGQPLPGSVVRISDAGEVLARGIGVFSGYRDARHNAEAFVNGYFRTGDIGRLDDEGRLILEGRLKDVIVTSNGKTIVPTPWEHTVESSPLVSHAVMVGEGRSYLSALLLLDPEETKKWADAEGITLPPHADAKLDEIADARLREHMQGVIDTANALVAHSEQVRRFTLVSTNLEDSTLITPTMKLKRRIALERASTVVENLYR